MMTSTTSRFAAVFLVVLALACDETSNPTAPTVPTTPTQNVGIGSGPGCYRAAYAGFTTSAFQCGLVSSSGNTWFDVAFQSEAAYQRDWFEETASVSLFDDCAGPNAYSSPEDWIIFGVRFADRMASLHDRELTLWQIMAHEFGHQVEFYFGYENRVGYGQRFELVADAISGLYITHNHIERLGDNIPAFAGGIWNSGDFNDPSHHGTPSQRVRSFIKGMEAALYELESGVTLEWPQLIDRFHDEITYDIIPRGSPGAI